MFQPLDGPSAQGALTLTSSTVQELKVNSIVLVERKVIEIQPLDGNIYYYYGDGINTPNAATVSSNGFLMRKERIKVIEASDTQHVFVVAQSSTVNVRFAERA